MSSLNIISNELVKDIQDRCKGLGRLRIRIKALYIIFIRIKLLEIVHNCIRLILNLVDFMHTMIGFLTCNIGTADLNFHTEGFLRSFCLDCVTYYSSTCSFLAQFLSCIAFLKYLVVSNGHEKPRLRETSGCPILT